MNFKNCYLSQKYVTTYALLPSIERNILTAEFGNNVLDRIQTQ